MLFRKGHEVIEHDRGEHSHKELLENLYPLQRPRPDNELIN